MEYQRKYNKQKITITVLVSVAVIAITLLVSFWIGPSMVSSTPETTLPPDTTLAPIEGELIINDDVLEAAIKKQLSITGELTKQDVEALEVLDYDEAVITDLTGLEYAIHLKELRIKVDVTSIAPIMSLHIQKLTLISDVSVQPLLEDIKEMHYIKYLDLSDCGISALGYISELPSLETLILDNNRISGLKYIAQVKTLATLSVKNCGLKDISELADNNYIQNLYIDDNLIEDISALNSMRALKNASYEGNPINEEK